MLLISLRKEAGRVAPLGASAVSLWSNACSNQAVMSASGAPGVKISATPARFSSGMSASGMIPPAKTSTSPAPWSPRVSMIRGNSVMCAPDRIDKPDGVGVLLDDGRGDLLRRLVQPGVDHLEAGFAQSPGDDPGPAVVTVEARLGYHHPVGALHRASDTRRSAPDRPARLTPLADRRPGRLRLEPARQCVAGLGMPCGPAVDRCRWRTAPPRFDTA